MSDLQARIAAAKAAKEAEAAGTDPKPEGTVSQDGATEGTDTGAGTQGAATLGDLLDVADGPKVDDDNYQAVSLPADVLAKLMANQEFQGLTGPITEDTTAEDVIADLQNTRIAVVSGESDIPLENLDKAIAVITATSDSLVYEEQLRQEQIENDRLKAEADAEVARILAEGGDIAVTEDMRPRSLIARPIGDYSFILGEKEYNFTVDELQPLSAVHATVEHLKNLRQTLASQNINIARMNPFAGSEINSAVEAIDYHITLLICTLDQHAESPEAVG